MYKFTFEFTDTSRLLCVALNVIFLKRLCHEMFYNHFYSSYKFILHLVSIFRRLLDRDTEESKLIEMLTHTVFFPACLVKTSQRPLKCAVQTPRCVD